jgi:hypothetical protein
MQYMMRRLFRLHSSSVQGEKRRFAALHVKGPPQLRKALSSDRPALGIQLQDRGHH